MNQVLLFSMCLKICPFQISVKLPLAFISSPFSDTLGCMWSIHFSIFTLNNCMNADSTVLHFLPFQSKEMQLLKKKKK